VLKLAVLTPPLVLKVPWPRLVAASLKITVPLGGATALLPGLFTVTVTVKVTNCPNTVELVEDATAVLVLALVTIWVRAPMLPAQLGSPL
jgi:hypothetical protein